MIYLDERQTGKMKLCLDIKPWVVAIGLLFIAFENLIGARTIAGVLYGYIALIIVLVIGLIVREYFKKGGRWSILAHLSLLFDSSVIIAGIYFHGNLESPWAFGPAFVTYMGAYVFGIAFGLAYAAYTSFMFLGVFLLEYLRIIPHFPIFNLPNLYWIDVGYFIDSLIGIFILNFVMAIAIGSLSKLTDRRNVKIEEYATKLEESYSKIGVVRVETERAGKLTEEKNAEVERNRKIIEDREAEITDAEKEIERLKKERGV